MRHESTTYNGTGPRGPRAGFIDTYGSLGAQLSAEATVE